MKQVDSTLKLTSWRVKVQKVIRVGDVYRHNKSGDDYIVAGFATYKKSRSADTPVVVYNCVRTSTTYVRAVDEFTSGIFTPSPTYSVKGFFGEFRWLSNFWLSEFEYEGLKYANIEAAYQAAKTPSQEDRVKFSQLQGTYMEIGRQAKKLGRQITLREDWELVKLQVMLELTRKKYSLPELQEKLLATGCGYLEETNTWNDTFWGVYNATGQNNLGKIIMQVRDEIRYDEYKRGEGSCTSMSQPVK